VIENLLNNENSDNRNSSPFEILQVAALQMVSSPDIMENLQTAAELIEMAAKGGATLISLPEYFCFMGHKDTDKWALKEENGDGPIQRFMSAQAQRHKVWIAGGTIPLRAPAEDRVFNTALVWGPDGRPRARYDKIHLFKFSKGKESYDESHAIRPGSSPVTLDIGGARVGLSVCYDLRFPELYRAMQKPDLILVPAAFTYTTGRAHWELLLRARAIENQCYVLAAAQGGVHKNGRRTWGHSMLIDPWGEIVDILEEGAGVVGGTIDPLRLAEVRESLPALQHRVM